MKGIQLKSILAIVTCLIFTSFGFSQTTVQKVQDSQVTIVSGNYSGSGTIILRGDTSWVLTCAHLFSAARTEREVYENGAKKTIVEFKPPKIHKILSDGKMDIGRIELIADVIRYSDATYGHDLALVKIRQKGALKQTTVFYLDDDPPPVNTDVVHCGSLGGEAGSNSITTGVISKIGRLYTDGKGTERVYDQSSCSAFPGSSGGPVVLKDGRYIGCLTRGYGETFNLFVPTRRIREWAKDNGVEFILDPSKPIPSDEELKKKPIEPHAPSSSWIKAPLNVDMKVFGSFPIYIEPIK